MTAPIEKVESILRNWKGESDEAQTTPHQVAADIDHAYMEYLNALRGQTVAIKAGQEAAERRCA